MTHNKIYGKTVEIQADFISMGSSPLILPNANPTTTPSFILSNANSTVATFTNAAGSARTDAGTAMTMYFQKLNSIVQITFQWGNLRTVANAVATALLTFNETVPLSMRPLGNETLAMQVLQNGTVKMGTMIITGAGVVTIGLGSGAGTFTIAQDSAVSDVTQYAYVSS